MYRYLLFLVSFAVISCSPIRKYQTMPEVQAWEKDIIKFEQLDKSEKYSRDAILFTGSSSIRLWSTLKQDIAPYPVIQRGFGGSIRKTHPVTPVFWIAITPTASRWKVWPEIQKANNLIKDVCESQKNTYFIRTDFAFLNESGIPGDVYFRSDKLHLTEQGYAVWTEIIKKELERVIKLSPV